MSKSPIYWRPHLLTATPHRNSARHRDSFVIPLTPLSSPRVSSLPAASGSRRIIHTTKANTRYLRANTEQAPHIFQQHALRALHPISNTSPHTIPSGHIRAQQATPLHGTVGFARQNATRARNIAAPPPAGGGWPPRRRRRSRPPPALPSRINPAAGGPPRARSTSVGTRRRSGRQSHRGTSG